MGPCEPPQSVPAHDGDRGRLWLGLWLRLRSNGDDSVVAVDRVIGRGDFSAQVGRDVVGEGLLVADAPILVNSRSASG